MESVWSVSKLSTESVGSRRELVANSVHTADADASQLDNCVASASAVYIGFSPVSLMNWPQCVKFDLKELFAIVV